MSQTAVSSANAGSPLLQLPQELLVRVASYVTTLELGHLRRVCKDVEVRLFESFAYEFFHKRQFMIEEPSLQALVDISKHPTLSKRLKEVIISTTCYDDSEIPTQKLYLKGYMNREALMWSGQARDMLVEAFTNLPNLRRVGVRDYDAKGRYRDGEKAAWRSYGHSVMDGRHTQTEGPDQPWILLLQAIGLSGAKVPCVEVFLRHQWRLSNKSFDMLSTRMAKTISPVLAELRTLMLTLGLTKVDDGGMFLDTQPPSDNRLRKFLHHTPNLEALRLNFDERTSCLLDWLALSPSTAASQTPSQLTDYNSPVALANLTKLDLGFVRVSPATLLSVISRFHLKSLNLWKILLEVDDKSAIKARDDGDSNIASKFLGKLATANATQGLEDVMIGYLKIGGKSDPKHRAYHVDFPPVGTPPNKLVRGTARGPQPHLKPKQQMVKFSLGGSAPNFVVWAREMAQRAWIKTLRDGIEVIEEESNSMDDDSEDGGHDVDDEEEDE